MRYFPLYEAKMFHQFDHRWATFAGASSGLEVDKLLGGEDDENELTNLQTYDPMDLDDEEEGEGGDKAKTRDCTLAEKQDPRFLPTPRYWVSEADVLMRAVPLSREEKKELERLDGEEVVRRLRPRAPKWLVAFRDITNTTNERTAIFSVLPLVGCGHKAPLANLSQELRMQLCFVALTDSIVWDWICRQKIGGTSFTLHYLKQIATLSPVSFDAYVNRITESTLELVYTSEHLRPLAEEVCRSGGMDKYVGLDVDRAGESEPPNLSTYQPINQQTQPIQPFPYNEDRRAHLRAELDALVARLYGLNRKQLRYILCPQGLSWAELENINNGWEDPTCSGPHALPAEPSHDFPGETFRVLREKEEKKFGEYRTRRLVLEAWDRLWQELGPVEPLPVRFGGLEVGKSVGLGSGRQGDWETTHLQTAKPANLETGRPLDAPVSTGLFAEVVTRSEGLDAGRFLGQELTESTSERTDLQPSQPTDFEFVAPEPQPPTPLKDKLGNIIRVRVLGASGKEIVSAGTVVGQRKQGDAVQWSVIADGSTQVRKFLSPPAELERLKS